MQLAFHHGPLADRKRSKLVWLSDLGSDRIVSQTDHDPTTMLMQLRDRNDAVFHHSDASSSNDLTGQQEMLCADALVKLRGQPRDYFRARYGPKSCQI
jgi:hypothetical protein